MFFLLNMVRVHFDKEILLPQNFPEFLLKIMVQ